MMLIHGQTVQMIISPNVSMSAAMQCRNKKTPTLKGDGAIFLVAGA